MFPGDRVVVRYRLAPPAPGAQRAGRISPAPGAQLSDVTGIVVDDGDPLVLTRVAPVALASADLVRIPVELITSVRLLSYRAVRNNEIRAVALRAGSAGESTDTAEIAGWLARPDSAVPARLGARLDTATVDELRRWYAERDRPAIVELPERLVPNAAVGQPVGGEFHRLILVDGDGTESLAPGSIATVSVDDVQRGADLRAQGFRLHHRVTYRQL